MGFPYGVAEYLLVLLRQGEVAVRLWLPLWRGRRIRLEMRSDSVSSLNMMLNFRSKGYGPNVIAQEMALLIAAGELTPDVLAHTPGVCNIIPDNLSRMYIPDRSSTPGYHRDSEKPAGANPTIEAEGITRPSDDRRLRTRESSRRPHRSRAKQNADEGKAK